MNCTMCPLSALCLPAGGPEALTLLYCVKCGSVFLYLRGSATRFIKLPSFNWRCEKHKVTRRSIGIKCFPCLHCRADSLVRLHFD